MNPGDTEQTTPEKNAQRQAQETAEQIVAEIRSSYNDRYAAVNKITDQEERIQKRAQLDREIQNDFRSRAIEQITRDAAMSQTDQPEDIQGKAKNVKRIFLEAKELSDQGTNVIDRKSQVLVDKIVEKIKSGEITDEGALAIERNIGKQLIEGVVFSKQGEQLSTTEQGLINLRQIDPRSADIILGNIAANPETYGTTAENLIQKFKVPAPENDRDSQREQTMEEISTKAFEGDFIQYYRSRFTQEQIELISTFYSPEAFVDYMERLSNGDDNGGKNFLTQEEVKEKKQEIEKEIKNYYEKNNKTLTDGELKEQVGKHWGEEVSEKMNWKVSDVINQLFLELQQKSPHKFYEQIMQEDIFQGPAMIQKRIQSAINSLMTKVDQIEGQKNNELADRIKKLNLYRNAVKESYVEERGNKEGGPNKNIFPGLKPLPYGEKVSLTDFIEYINMTIDHTTHKAEYFHNSRAIYGHPPGKEGFYNQLGEFAEQLKGTDIDEIMLLPDGQYIMQAYQLYEKMLQEDFAQMDHRHRPDQLTNKLERVNSQIELQVIEQLKSYYPDLTGVRVRNIVNSAVGISRGVFLTESEQSAYADPFDSEGKGMVASYSTNDAGSLNVFNPMHTIMRWQGEHNFNAMYFMPVKGEPGMWDHNKAWKNAAKYMDSFLVGKGRGEGKDKLPEEMFADSMMDIGNVGGPGKRKGWRTKYALEGHFVRDPDGTINAPKTFQAMEAIGYEAIYNFYLNHQAGDDLLKATESTAPDQVKERKDLFRYIFKKYFYDGDPKNFQESDLDNYLAKLRIKGEENALDRIKKHGSLSSGDGWEVKSIEEQVAYETSELFMENTLAHYVAARFPTKFLRIDKNRLNDDGVSLWEKTWREFKTKGWERRHFDKVMKDMTMAEMLLRREISEKIRENMKFDPEWTLSQIDKIKDLPYRLDEDKIKELLSKNKKKQTFKTEKEISDVIELFQHIKKDFKNNEFLDSEGAKKIKNYTFTFGLEDTDISLMTFRGTGPRMVARAIKDVGSIENTVTPWILKMPIVLNEIAVNGKHDFSPIIEYMRAAQKAITDINGVPDTYAHMYKMAGTIINYFKKDGMAKPLFGIFGLGKRNSIAAEYAGRSTAVWEWDSRDIDRFCVALESTSLLKNSPYNLQKFDKGKFTGGKLEDRWIKIPGLKKPIKFGKKRHVDYEFNSLRLRKEHGADWPAISWDILNQVAPVFLVFLWWQYFKKALEEAEGKKK